MNRDRAQPRIGEVLLGEGAISSDDLKHALASHKQSGLMLGEFLVEQGLISAPSLVAAIARTLGVQGCQLRHGLIDPSLMTLMDADELESMRAIPMFRVRDELTVAMAEPQSLPTIDRLREVTGCTIRPVFAMASNVQEFIHKYRDGDQDVDSFLATLVDSDVTLVEREAVDEGPITDLDQMVAGSPIVNLVNVSLLTATKDGASDIHVEPMRDGTRIRYRIDGMLRDLMKPPGGMHSPIVARIKIMARMDIGERRLPQEGRIRIVVEGRQIDVRVSSIPTLLGEKLVMRILDKENLRVRLDELGMHARQLESFERMLRQPHGLLLVTGPTGSGKTTTLYSGLDLLRCTERNIVTVEDPVEYQLDEVNQIQVQSSIGLTFARALRSILRQDPDIIMIGEIRDEETARVAVQAAITGHLVLATLHTNNATSAVARLLDMEIEPYLLSGALNGVVAQRLARRVCAECGSKYFPAENVLQDAGCADKVGRPFRKGIGCSNCYNTGFHGRVGVFEVMEVTSGLRKLIHCAGSVHDFREEFRASGGRSLREEAVLVALEGDTSLEEALRVSSSEDEPLPDEAPPPATIAPNEAGSRAA